MINYFLSGSATLANVPEKDFAFLFPLFSASLSLFSLHSSPHCGPRAGRDMGGMVKVEEWYVLFVFLSGLTHLLLWDLIVLQSLCF